MLLKLSEENQNQTTPKIDSKFDRIEKSLVYLIEFYIETTKILRN